MFNIEIYCRRTLNTIPPRLAPQRASARTPLYSTSTSLLKSDDKGVFSFYAQF